MSRPLMSRDEAPSDRTYSTTWSSAHCMARCKMVVSSKTRPLMVLMDEMLVLGPPSAVSLMAREMEAVSPLLRASTMRNLRTDCSRVAVLSTGRTPDLAAAGFWWDGDRARAAAEGEVLGRRELELIWEFWRLDEGMESEAREVVVGERSSGPEDCEASSSWRE